jgi:hypothetical protein
MGTEVVSSVLDLGLVAVSGSSTEGGVERSLRKSRWVTWLDDVSHRMGMARRVVHTITINKHMGPS